MWNIIDERSGFGFVADIQKFKERTSLLWWLFLGWNFGPLAEEE